MYCAVYARNVRRVAHSDLRGCAIQQIDGIQGIRLSPEFMEAPTRYRQV